MDYTTIIVTHLSPFTATSNQSLCSSVAQCCCATTKSVNRITTDIDVDQVITPAMKQIYGWSKQVNQKKTEQNIDRYEAKVWRNNDKTSVIDLRATSRNKSTDGVWKFLCMNYSLEITNNNSCISWLHTQFDTAKQRNNMIINYVPVEVQAQQCRSFVINLRPASQIQITITREIDLHIQTPTHFLLCAFIVL